MLPSQMTPSQRSQQENSFTVEDAYLSDEINCYLNSNMYSSQNVVEDDDKLSTFSYLSKGTP